MPGYDGTGPQGAGTMTGHGGGYCIKDISEADNRAAILGVGRGGRPRGGGGGRCFGGHRHFQRQSRPEKPSEKDDKISS